MAKAPGPQDMADAKILYVQLQCKWDSGVDGAPTEIAHMRSGCGDGGLTKAWSGMDGLRHKYFLYSPSTDVVSGVYGKWRFFFLPTDRGSLFAGILFVDRRGLVPPATSLTRNLSPPSPLARKYCSLTQLCSSSASPPFFSFPLPLVFFNQEKMDAYMATDLFASHMKMPHFKSVIAEPLDVMSGTELSIEKTAWANTPPTRDDLTKAVMLIVKIKMKYDTGIDQLPTKKEDLYGFMSAAGMGYPGQFGGLKGLRGKYFAYDEKTDRCFGFYTFVDRESLDEYMASDLFSKQGDPPHIADLTYTVHEVLPGTEEVMDQGEWTGK